MVLLHAADFILRAQLTVFDPIAQSLSQSLRLGGLALETLSRLHLGENGVVFAFRRRALAGEFIVRDSQHVRIDEPVSSMLALGYGWEG